MTIYPVVPVRDMIIFPSVIAPVFVSRPRSIRAVDEANSRDRLIFITAQINSFHDNPRPDDIQKMGTICKILQTVRLPDGTLKVILEGGWRAKAKRFITGDNYLEAEAEKVLSVNNTYSNHAEALRRSLFSELETYIQLNPKIPDDVVRAIDNIDNADIFADVAASHTTLKQSQKQIILEEADVIERLRKLLIMLNSENELLSLERNIQEKVHAEMDKGQKQYYLREQLKVIRSELGDADPTNESDELRERAAKCDLPEDIFAKLSKEIDRYSRMAPVSPEANVARTYIEWIMELPWKVSSNDQLDLKNARRVLEEDHYGLAEVKERILEFLAVRKLAADNMRAQVICFVGPPGVGKTSLGKSIARAMGRKFVNMSLGGLRDEAEIRGHRRTYVGALPGRIIQKIKQAGTNNPVLLMDEIDKIGTDFRGDPASALLEVLDPEQNFGFTDNFLETAFDLSKVMFITTANSVSTIPKPLLDRMEIISIPGYVAEEKIKIAKRHLMPRIAKEHGLGEKTLSMSDAVLKNIISMYTMEAGVRALDRVLSKIARKVTVRITEDNADPCNKVAVTKAEVAKMLGAPKLHNTKIPQSDPIGTALGLAWTETGGVVMLIEAAVMNGSGHVSYTGNLGDIMQESAQTALAYLRSNAPLYGLTDFEWQKHDLHIHVPEGAVPKDGPSAGITLALSLCSALTGRYVDMSFAMTGEMTLHGDVLPIGGIREKLLAAKRLGIKKLIVPEDNRPDVVELNDWITKDIAISYVSKITEVFALALRQEN